MPRKPTTPKPIILALTSDKTGVTLKVGNSPTTAATLYPRHVTELARLLNVTLATDGKSAANWIEAVKTAEAERDAARKQEATWKENYHLAAQERSDLREEKATLVSKTFQLSEELNAERRLVENLRADNEQIGKERDQLTSDLNVTDLTLSAEEKKVMEWQAAAERNLADYHAAKRDLAEVAAARDAAIAEAKSLRGSANLTIDMLQDSLRRAKTSRLIVGLVAVAACIATRLAFGGAR